MRGWSCVFVMLISLEVALSFGVVSLKQSSLSSSSSSDRLKTTRLFDGDGTGGWGIGGSRELTPEEFAKGRDRSYFDGYQMNSQSDFRTQLQEEKRHYKNLN